MKTVAKNYKIKADKINKQELYDVTEAIKIVLANATAKFDETVEIHVKLGVDGTKADEQVRTTVVLPAGTGKTLKVLVIAKGDKAEEATSSGADLVGAEDMITKIQGGFLDFDVCITTPDMMPLMGRIAKILGPKGLMPNPKSGTVTTDVKKAIADVKAGKVECRIDKQNIVHTILGKASFGEARIKENYDAVIGALLKAKPAAAKGAYFKSISLASTQSPAVRVKTI